MAATGNNTDCYSRRTVINVNPGEGSPVQFYTRVFGRDFRDPNAADFKPESARISDITGKTRRGGVWARKAV